MKGIVLAGGTGSRLYPLTKVTNKHLLPIWNKPMIYYPLETLVRSGIDDILVVSGGEHLGDIIELLGGSFNDVPLTYKCQDEPDGISGAIRRCREWVGNDEIFAVILADNIFEDTFYLPDYRNVTVFLKEVLHPEQYGVPIFEGDKIVKFVEKPNHVTSCPYALTGLYVLHKSCFDIPLIKSGRGEYEIVDLLNNYNCDYEILPGFWCDAGSFEGLVLASEQARKTHKKY